MAARIKSSQNYYKHTGAPKLRPTFAGFSPKTSPRCMALTMASLNSGSNGNCYYVGDDTEAVFIDAGLSCRETEHRMVTLGLDMQRVKAIFVSHEHADHINGVARISRKYDLPVYITPATQRRMRAYMQAHRAVPFVDGEAVQIGRLSILPFKKYHDGCDPHSFTISGGGVNIGIFTDLGRVCASLIDAFRHCHAALLESNYDEVMLDQGPYPAYLKARIRGGNGHLSNREALDLFTTHRPAHMSHLLLGHLSRENNHPLLVEELFRAHAGGVTVAVASRYQPSAVYTIADAKPVPVAAFGPRPAAVNEQLALAF